MLAGIHEIRKLGPAGADLIGHAMLCLGGMGAVRLLEGLADCCGHDGVLALGDVGQRVAHPVDAAALPSCFEGPSNGGLEACMGIADHQFHPIEPATTKGPQEVRPERLGFRRADAQSDDFPAAFGVGCHGYYGCNRDDPPALTLLELGGIEPDIGPVAGQGAVQELADPFINVFAQL